MRSGAFGAADWILGMGFGPISRPFSRALNVSFFDFAMIAFVLSPCRNLIGLLFLLIKANNIVSRRDTLMFVQ